MFAHCPTGIHALPVELLTRIVVLGAQDYDPYFYSPFLLKPDQHYYAVPSTTFQLAVSHVCQHWRNVALRTPSLWTTLCFRETSHIPRAVAYLERCSRSPNRRLDILVDTVAPQDHIPGVTLCIEELSCVFSLIMPHVLCWRAFHLKVRDNACKMIARKHLGSTCPAPNLETLQLYHFEDFRQVQDLYIATYRPPVQIFSNTLPNLRNVSLIGVNLPWDQSPYLLNLHTLELALHSDNIRPPYIYWDRMLRHSPNLQRLFLHYSGPRAENGTEDLEWTPMHDGKGKGKQDDSILLESLWELSLTDLDPDYLCLILDRLVMPNVNKLSLDLPDQDFTPFVELIAPTNLPTASAQRPPIHHHSHLELADLPSTFPQSHDQTLDSPCSSSPSSLGCDSWGTSGTSGTSNASPSSRSSTPPYSPTLTSKLPDASSLTTSSSASTVSTTASAGSISNNGTAVFKRLPLPRLAMTLEMLIITALECDSLSWKGLIGGLIVLETLEINFWKVKVTETGGYDGTTGGGAEWKALIERVTEEVKVKSGGITKKERMVLPNLKKCKIAGLRGTTVHQIISERERAAEFGECRGNVEWSVVEDKFMEIDPELYSMFETGIWVSRDGEKEGRWVQVEKVTEEDEDEDDEDENEESGEGEDSDRDEAEQVTGGVVEREEEGEEYVEDEVDSSDGDSG